MGYKIENLIVWCKFIYIAKLFNWLCYGINKFLEADPWIKTSSQEETVNWSIRVVPR